MKKIIFIDVDGTLLGKNGKVPKSAFEAVRKVRENGHKVFICTGRSAGEIFGEIKTMGYDGMVGAAGAYVESDGIVIYKKSMKKETANIILDYFEKNHIDYMAETDDMCYANEKGYLTFKDNIYGRKLWNKEQADEFMKRVTVCQDGRDIKEINKFLYFNCFKSLSDLKNDIGAYCTIVPSTIESMRDNSGEISEKGMNKSVGMRKVLEYLNCSRDCTIAFGDSSNDFEMIKYAKLGIAMGNSSAQLKKIADDITDSADENGIYNSLKKYALI